MAKFRRDRGAVRLTLQDLILKHRSPRGLQGFLSNSDSLLPGEFLDELNAGAGQPRSTTFV